MTTTTPPISHQQTEEINPEDTAYLLMPMEASEIDTGTCSYGAHLVPLDTSGEYDLPLLLAQTATREELPTEWTKWGRVNRSSNADGWLHYTTDAKFQTLLRAPEKLIETGARFTSEINVSTFIEDPLPVALSQLWRKRCSSRVFQDAGVKVFVDLHVDGITRALVMEGVPKEHELFCTKYVKHNLDGDYLGMEAVIEDYDLVMDHVAEGTDVKFLVYGAPRSAAAEMEERGWIDVPPVSNRLGGSD